MMKRIVADMNGGQEVDLSPQEEILVRAEWKASDDADAEKERLQGPKRRRLKDIDEAMGLEDRLGALQEGLEAVRLSGVAMPQRAADLLQLYKDARETHPDPS